MTDTVDVSWPQGDYMPASGIVVGMGAWSLDGGKPFIQTTYHEDVDNAHAKGDRVVHYAFNGRTDSMSPEAFADYCFANLYGWKSGDGIALDVETSEKGKYPAWSPALAERWRARMVAHIFGLCPGIYGPESEMTKPGWGALEKAGCWLWIAWPGAASEIRLGEWSRWHMWQFSTAGGIDHDHVSADLISILDSQEQDVPLTPADAETLAASAPFQQMVRAQVQAVVSDANVMNAQASTFLNHGINSDGNLAAQVAAIYARTKQLADAPTISGVSLDTAALATALATPLGKALGSELVTAIIAGLKITPTVALEAK